MPDVFAQGVSKLPLNLRVSSKLPHLFSFPSYVAPEGLLKEISLTFNKAVPHLNEACVAGASLVCGDTQAKIEYNYLEILIENKAAIEAPAYQPIDWVLYTRIITAIMMLQRNALNLKLDYLNHYLDVLLNMPSAKCTDEIRWYIACLVYFRVLMNPNGKSKRTDIEIWMNILVSINSQPHRDGIYGLLLLYATRNHQITMDVAHRLDAIYQNRPYSHIGTAVRNKHHFVRLSLHNQNYFKFETALPVVGSGNLKSLTVKFSNDQHTINLSKLQLLKFAAHLYPLTNPIFQIALPQLSGYDNDQITHKIHTKLREKGWCNSTGALKPAFFPKEKPAQEQRQVDVQKILFDSIYSYTGSRRHYWQQEVAKWQLDTYKSKFASLLAFKDKLEGLAPDTAILLLRKCLAYEAQHGLPNNLRLVIRDMLLVTAEACVCAHQIENKNTSNFNKHKQWFALAKEMTDKFLKAKQTMVHYVGVPREAVKVGETPAHHAMYVVFRYFIENGEDKIQFIMVNGGYGAKFFHRSATLGVAVDDEDRDYAACKPFTDTPANRTMLEHYMYNVLSLKYRTATSKYQESPGDGKNRSQNSFEDVMRDFYCRSKNEYEESYFRGFQFKRFDLERQDLTTGCINQFMGNCTIHNLKKALQIGYSMDDEMYGRLEDQLLIGFDKFIEENPTLKL